MSSRVVLSWALATAIAALALAGPALAARRTVLFEENTNWGCPPCFTANPVIHQFLEDYSVSQVIAVKWHVWWPNGVDPYYLHNPTPVQNRISYYGINAAPDCVVDGTNGPIPGSYGSMQQFVENLLALTSPIALTATGAVNGGNYDATITVNVEQVPVAGDYRLFVTLSEHHIHLPSPNGEQEHYDVFRKTTNNTGESINLTSVGQQVFNRSFPIDGSYQTSELQVIAWVQNFATREVLNTATTWPKPAHFVRLAAGTPGVVNNPNTIANLSRNVINLGSQNDVYDISANPLIGSMPAGWTW
ncbi:MAG TPA: Omp28-related outer membrane protein, partial [Candidatus Udaeobacter sp.]|nr:Omp28-related outer membrane protein [Candidatus Udaeobacter sp.]